MTLPQSTIDLSARVDDELRSIVTSRQVPLYEMMSYHLGWKDPRSPYTPLATKERRHGVLCLLSCRAAGGDIERALPAAAAVELVHSFTEVHDDVQGGNPQRDSRDAVWWVWGPAQAINAGDGMHALARLALFRLRDSGVSPERMFRAVQLLDEASLKTCEGRFMDLEAQERIDLSVDAYFKMAAAKTGSLFACAMKLGALLGTDDESVQMAFWRAGENLGIAVQVRSDLEDIWGREASPEVLNKKKLLPIVYALEKAGVHDKRRLGEIYFKRVLEPDDVGRLRQVLEELGVREDSERLLEQYRAEALAALDTPGLRAEGKAGLVSYMRELAG